MSRLRIPFQSFNLVRRGATDPLGQRVSNGSARGDRRSATQREPDPLDGRGRVALSVYLIVRSDIEKVYLGVRQHEPEYYPVRVCEAYGVLPEVFPR